MQPSKLILILAFSMLALASCSKGYSPADAGANTAADEAAIREQSLNWFRAYNAEDIEALMAMYAEDAVQINPGEPPVRGRTAIRNAVAVAFANPIYDSIDVAMNSATEYGLSGDMAWESGSYTNMDASRTPLGVVNFVTIYKKIDDKWLIVRDIWNSQTDAAASVSAPASVPATAAN